MKHLLYRGGIFALTAFIAAGLFISCNKEEEQLDPSEKTQLETPVVSVGEATESSLTFSWEAVSNAAGYKYDLLDEAGASAKSGSTTETSITIGGLASNSTYTFKLTATAAKDSDYTDSNAASATGTTASAVTPKTQLATPVVTVGEATVNSLTFSWEAVDNANGYAYELLDEDEASVKNGSTTETTITIDGLASSSTYTFKLTATAAEDSDYIDSDAASATGTTVGKTQLATPVISVGEATESSLTFSWDAVENANGYAYELLNEGGASVKNGSTTETTITIEGLASGSTYTFKLTATAAEDSDYIDSDAASATGTTEEVDNTSCLVGTYTEDTQAWDWFWCDDDVYDAGGEKYAYNYNDEVIISRIDNNKISITNFFWMEDSLIGVVDLAARTITFEPQNVVTWYTFASYDNASTVVATFDENFTITISNWSIWYGQYCYVDGLCWYDDSYDQATYYAPVSTLTKNE